MKRIYLLFLMLTAAFVGANAQRNINLQVTMEKPTSSTVVNWGGSFDYDVVIKNLGPDSLRAGGSPAGVTDSILWYASISGTLVNFSFGSQSGTYWLRYNRSLKMNDTLHMKLSGLNFPNMFQEVDSNRTFCFYALPRGQAGDTIKDNPTTDNFDCASFMFKKNKFPDAIQSVSRGGNHIAKVYPNPAADFANIDIITQSNANITIRVMDIAGRVVCEEKKGYLSKGNHIFPVNTSNLHNGLYIYEAYVDEDVIKGKFNVAK